MTDVPDDIREAAEKLFEPYVGLYDGPSEDDVIELLVAERARDVSERLRLWIWEQIDKHGENLVATQPTFDLVLNKIDEFRSDG